MASVKLTKVLKDELDIGTKLTNLEERAVKLETEFATMFLAAKELVYAAKRYNMKTQTEIKSWDLMETICSTNECSREIFDHVRVFFNFLLDKLKSNGADVTDIKMLWHLVETEGVRQAFIKSIKCFGFKKTDFEHLKVLLALTYKMQLDLEKECSNSKNVSDDKTKEIKEELNNGSYQNLVETTCDDTTCNGNQSDSTTDMETLIKQYYASFSSGDTTGEASDSNTAVTDDDDANERGDLEKCAGKNGVGPPHMTDTYFPDLSTGEVNTGIIKCFDFWGVDDGMRHVIKMIVMIVVYYLNVGRDGEMLSIAKTRPETDDEVEVAEILQSLKCNAR